MSSLKASLAKALNIVTKDFVREKRRAHRDQLSEEPGH
jgi:hypothetical protein